MGVVVLGSLNVDWVAQVAVLPQAGETLMATGLARHVGGKGANQSVAAARAGSATRMIGCVGRDDAGDWLLKFLQHEGVATDRVSRHPTAPTGQAFVALSEDGQNTVIVAPGANQCISASASGGGLDCASQERILLAQLETNLEPIAAFLSAAAPPCLKILNTAPAVSGGAALLPLCDVIVLNETELTRYAGAGSLLREEGDIVDAARALLSPGQAVVVTLGSRGALLIGEDAAAAIAGRSVPVVDTVGAGDCFCGVLAAGLDQGLSLDAAVRRANTAASLAVGRRGAAQAMPTRADIDAAHSP